MPAGRPLYKANDNTEIAQILNRLDSLERRRAVTGFYEIKIFADDTVIEAGEGVFIFAIPLDLDRAKLRYVNAFVTTPSSSGLIQIQIHNLGSVQDPAGFDMLESFARLTIDVGDLDAEDSTTDWEIRQDYANEYDWPFQDNTVFYRQQLRIDLDSDGTGAMGLGIMLGFE